MAGPSLYFPEGIPSEVQRLLDPDEIHKLTQAGLKDWEDGVRSRLAPIAKDIVSGQRSWWRKLLEGGWKGTIDPEIVRSILYGSPKKWPSGLSKEEKNALRILRLTRPLAMSQYKPTGRLPTPPEDAVTFAFKMMAKDSKREVLNPMWKLYNKVAAKVGRRIEPLCESIYSEPCERGEGVELFLADVTDAAKINRLSVSGDTVPLLRAFLRIYNAA
jgi:hypothetical protein